MSVRTLRRRAHAVGLTLSKTRTETSIWLLLRGRRVIAVAHNVDHIARLLGAAAAA